MLDIPMLMSELLKFIRVKTHTTEEYKDIITKITKITFAKESPMYDFYWAPASTKFHGSFTGGLALHSLTVYYCALLLAEAFGLQKSEIDCNACIFHDLVKAGLYRQGFSGYTYNYDAVLLPHGCESLYRIKEQLIPISSKAWEYAIAYHMGAFEQDNIGMFSKACEKYPEVLLLHTADMMATKIYGN